MVDWHSKEFQEDLEISQEAIKDQARRIIYEGYDSIFTFDEVEYMAEELASDFSNRLIQVIRKVMP